MHILKGTDDSASICKLSNVAYVVIFPLHVTFDKNTFKISYSSIFAEIIFSY
jgi:hypothetical protein